MFNIEIQRANDYLNIDMKLGETLYVLGANGVGKSSLMQRIFTNYSYNATRILAHRQGWFSSNVVDISATQKKASEEQIKANESSANSRFSDHYGSQKPILSIFNLVNAENSRAKKIAAAVDIDDFESAKRESATSSPLSIINELFALSNIPIEIFTGPNEEFLARRNGSTPYSITELSDGERNAFLICADVLTAPPARIIILDEPERHLHRSIIAPLLSGLFQKRKDCAFIISTHDVHLPLGQSESKVLLVRGCTWLGSGHVSFWDADLMAGDDDIAEDIKREILGAKRDILFVEGTKDSLDKHIYQILFPNLSVMPQGSCTDVERSVDGIRNTLSLHWVNAYGLIDADDRTTDQIEALSQKGIAAINAYSVESLYYNITIVRLLAERYSKTIGGDAETLFNTATSGIKDKFLEHKSRLCGRVCEKKARQFVMGKLPKYKNLLEADNYPIEINLKELRDNEFAIFDSLVSQNNLNGLISRYPVRETPVLDIIARAFNMDTKSYENFVRTLVNDNETAKITLLSLLSGLTTILHVR